MNFGGDGSPPPWIDDFLDLDIGYNCISQKTRNKKLDSLQFSRPITFTNPIWLVLRTAMQTDHEIAILRQRVKYLAILPNMEGAVVLFDDGRGLLQPKNAFHVAENVIFVFDGSSKIRLVLYRNPAIIFTSTAQDDGISFSTTDLASFLYFVGENAVIMKMLQIDGCFGVIDRYIIAMAFIYLKRANCEYFSDTLTVLAAFLLAHKMEEDECPGRAMTSLIFKAIRQITNENTTCHNIHDSNKQALISINEVALCQSQLFEKILYRGLVSREECDGVIAVIPHHPIWKRWRLAFHAGAVRDSHHLWKLQFIQNSGAAFFSTSLENPIQQKCIMCKGNATYCQSVQARFTMESNAHTQKIHLNNVLVSVKTTNTLHNRTFNHPIPQTYQNWKDFACNAHIDGTLPLDYLQLLQIENQIENVLADEKWIENLFKYQLI